MKNFNTNTVNNDEWLTPPSLLKQLGKFDLDPCVPINRPWDTATYHYTKEEDGLAHPWIGRVWLNPPYDRETFNWIKRLREHCQTGGSGLALIFARTETRGFQEDIFQAGATILFIKGRLRFHYVDGQQGNSANAPSCLVAFSEQEASLLRQLEASGLGKVGVFTA